MIRPGNTTPASQVEATTSASEVRVHIAAGEVTARRGRHEGRVMKLVVIGGTGLVGSQVVKKLIAAGHEAVPATPDTGVDLITGKGLDEVLEGAQVVINVANSPTFDEASLDFFRTSMNNLLAAGERADGVPGLVGRRECVRRAKLDGLLPFEADRIDGHDVPGPRDPGPLDGVDPDAADPEHHDGVARLGAGRPHRAADAGSNAAADQGG